MCLVKLTLLKALVPSCTTKVSEDLIVDTESEVVKEQEGVLEFLLINHPLIVRYVIRPENVHFRIKQWLMDLENQDL